MTLLTTGTVARRLGKSREALMFDLRKLGIEPQRDSMGRRLLTEQDLERLIALQRQRRRRRKAAQP
jgi:DNA-binding transcriptional MerR regulator